MKDLIDRIFKIDSEEEFSSLALDIFRFQSSNNVVYAKYIEYLKINVNEVKMVSKIPFLPIEFFKSHVIKSTNQKARRVFESSGTTGQQTSKHHIVSTELYSRSFLKSFSASYGNPENLCILALLPSYLERENSSLVYMMNHLIQLSQHPDSGFYLNNFEDLSKVLKKRNQDKSPTLLLGVSFALLDLADNYPLPLSESITVMETGGMKGRRKEMIREELHEILKEAFHLSVIHSEYGMTELLSQSYSGGNGNYTSPPWMNILIRDPYDPMAILPLGQSGAINIIDLANIYSCCFIATGDLGKLFKDGSFEISGRMDISEVRGCNLMVN